MTRNKALQDLLAKVEADDELDFSESFMLARCFSDEPTLVWNSYHGSLDAAKALHEAVLPGWAWTIQDNSEQTLWPPNEIADELWCVDGITAVYPPGDNPARAWLIAILKALIAEEGHD